MGCAAEAERSAVPRSDRVSPRRTCRLATSMLTLNCADAGEATAAARAARTIARCMDDGIRGWRKA
jgi:hypothetical protein